MRRNKLSLIRSVLLILFVRLLIGAGFSSANAQSFTVDKLLYSVMGEGVSVMGHVNGQSATGLLTIPESVVYEGVTYSVSSIYSSAFEDCSSLIGNLVIPNSVISIGSDAFRNCSGFTGLTIGNSVAYIDAYAFAGCSGFTGSLIIPNSVISIGPNAFWDCSGFTGDLVVPDSVTLLGRWAFFGCSGFTGSLTLPNSITLIDDNTFTDCSGFTGALNIPNAITVINTSAFRNCSGFTSLNLPNTVIEIGDSAFEGCSGFTGSLSIPNSLTYLAERVFSGCSGFTGNLIIPNTVRRIEMFAFSNCSSLSGDLIIPDSVTFIGSSAFKECRGFTGTLTIGNSVDTIAGGAFYNCNGFTGDLVIPNSVTTIGGESTSNYSGAFYGCSGFSGNLIIGNAVNIIGSYSFIFCDGLTGELVIPSSVTTICNHAFCGCNGLTGVLHIPSTITEISDNAFQGCSGLKGTLSLPGSLSSIGKHAFDGCSGFTGVLSIPNSVTSICDHAFNSCSGFTSLIIGNSVRTIGAGAFYGCSGFKGDLVIPNSVITIDEDLVGYYGAFARCDGFDGNLILSDALTAIGKYAFYGCSGFTGSLIIPNSVNRIGKEAFGGCSGFTGELILPNSITTIENEAFSGCSGFTGDLVIPDSVTALGIGAFGGCGGFDGGLTIGCFLTTINFNTFFNCSGITSVTIGNSVTSIGNSAFSGCTSLTSVTLGHSIADIGFDVFYDTNLSSIYVFTDTPPIVYYVNHANYSFPYTNRAIPVYVPCDALEEYQNAEGWSEFTNYQCINLPSYYLSATADPNNGGAISGAGVYYQNEICPLIATASEGYSFINWTKDGVEVSTSPTFGITVTEPGDYMANFVLNNYAITTTANPGLGGTVTGAGNYDHGATVTVIASSNEDYTFINWTDGDCLASMDMEYSFVATSDRNLIANFSDNSDYLTVSVDANPSIGGIVTGGGSYLSGQTAVLTAIANEGFVFKNWTSNGVVVSTTVTYSFTVTYSTSLMANFVEEDNIDFVDSNVKTICVAHWDANGDNEVSYSEAANVTWISSSWFSNNNTITSFDELQYFTGLTTIYSETFQNCRGLISISIPMSVTSIDAYAFFRCSSLESMTVLAPSPSSLGTLAFYNVNKSIPVYVPCASLEAYQNALGWNEFTNYHCLNDYTITAIADPANGGVVSGAGVYYQSATCTLIATPSVGYSFVNWTKDGIVVSNSATYSFNVEGEGCYVAHFVLNNYDVTVSVYPEVGGIVDGIGNYNHGEDCTLLAIANEGYTFVNWTENGSQVSLDTEYSFVVTSDRNLVANFTESSVYYSVLATANPEEGGIVAGGGDYLLGQTAVLTATANEGYLFTNWSSNGTIVSTTSTFSFTVVQDVTIVANFVGGANIVFVDPNVKAICVANWDANGDSELSYEEAAAVTSLGQVFNNNSSITSFDELQYFTGLTLINYMSFSNCSGMTSVSIPTSITGIGFMAFEGCTSLSSITLPNSITDIGQQAFWGCTELSAVYYQGTISQWCDINFYSMGNPVYYAHNLYIDNNLVTELIIPDDVTQIKDYVFYGATCLTSLTLNNFITSIGGRAFAGCSNLVSLTVHATTPPVLGSYSFNNISLSIPVYVPCDTQEIYQSADGWSAFTNIQEDCSQTSTQSTELSSGWYWWSPTIETNIEAVQTALGNNLMQIRAKNAPASGDVVPGTMYRIQTNDACTLSITGVPITTATVTINHDENWFGYIGTEKAVGEVFDASFGPAVDDKIISQDEGFAVFNGTEWEGTLTTLVPGKGYVYVSNATNPKTLVIGE